MNRICLVALLCVMGTFVFAQNDCRTQDSLTLTSLKNRFQFKPGFEWNLDIPMENWHGIGLSPEGCVQQLDLSGVLDFFYTYTFSASTLPQLTHINLSDNNLIQMPDLRAATQLQQVNVANNRLNFYDLQQLPNTGAELVYTPQTVLNCPTDIEIFVGTDYTIELGCYATTDETFVWYKDGIVIDTTTTHELELTNITSSDAGVYKAFITDTDFPGLALETAPIVLSMGNCRERDSLILVDFYSDVQFKTTFDWDLESPLESWYGVTLSPEGCVQALDLSGTIHRQDDYYYGSFNDLSQLDYLALNDNNLNALPDLTEANQLTYLNVADNNLDFQDLLQLPDMAEGEVMYAPQGIINCPMDITAYVNTPYTIRLDYYGTNNDIFVWHKDGTTIVDTTETYRLELTDIQPSDAGVYIAIITDENFPDLTLETAQVVLNVEGCRKRDSLSLVQFHANINFKPGVPQWDFSQPINTWYGVVLSDGGCVERLELSGALEDGFISQDMSLLSDLTYLDLSNNKLSSVFGILDLPALTYLNIQNNQLNLGDLLPFASVEIDALIYTPQLPVPVSPGSVVDIVGSTVSMKTYPYVYQNPGHVFKWYRDGVEIATITDETLLLDNLQVEDSGVYTCEMTNWTLPGLTLYSDSVRVDIAPDEHSLDSLILVDFYKSSTFKPEYKWILSKPIISWEGVTLNAEGRVQELVLPNGLTEGELVISMHKLDNLEVIDLSNNNLTGGFITFGNNVIYSSSQESVLPYLSYVDLSNNQLSETVNISRLAAPQELRHLDFSNNAIRNFYDIRSTTNIEYLNLSNNPIIYTSLPEILPQSEDLGVLKLANNGLAGSNIFNYNYEYIAREQFHTIEVQNNRLTDLLTDFFEPSVNSLNVSHNELTFEDLLQPNIPNIYIYAPQDSVGTPYAVHMTSGSDYTIYLDFDATIENNNYAWYKDGNLMATTTEGSLPLTNLQSADTGEYTCQVTNTQLSDLTLYTTPVTIFVDEVYGADCRLRDSLALVQIGGAEMTGGNPLWDFSQPLESWNGIRLSSEGCVSEVNISDDCLHHISPAIGQLLDVEFIRFDENLLSGTIPRTIGNLTNLHHFAITDDAIEGPIPIELTTLPNLEVLKLESDFSEIPPEIGNLTSLKQFLIGGDFTELPDEIGNLVNLESLRAFGDLTSLPATMTNMTNLKNVDLDRNQLHSLLPNFAENWVNLESIDLGNNDLTYDDLLQFQDFDFGYQNIIGTPTTIERSVGDDFLIDLGFDNDVTDNTYVWFRNSIPIDTTMQNTFILNNVQLDDVGIYTCQVHNINIPNYILNTAPVTLTVGGTTPEGPVYPGDVNADGIVNSIDILFWGLAEGNSGHIRPDASAIWAPQPSPDWVHTVVGIDAKHQDADGNSMVDAADLDIIEANYGRTTADYEDEFYQNDALQLSPQITQAQNFASSSSYSIEINLGNNVQGVTSIHGISFSLDLSRFNSINSYTTEITDTDSWLAPSNIVSIQNDELKRSDFALTRNNLQNRTGIGSIGTAIIITQDLPSSDIPQLCVVVRDIIAIQKDGTILNGEDVFIGSFSNGNTEGAIPGLAFEAVAYAATCEAPSSATVTVTSGTPPFQYQWSNGDTQATAENLSPGDYEVVITDDFGQTLTGIVVVPNGTPLPDIELQTNTDGQIELATDITDIQYAWNGLPGTSVTSLTPGQHTLTLNNAANCSKTASIWVADIYSNIILEGAYDVESGLMRDHLRELNLIPLTDPYMGRITTTDAVLQVAGNSAIVDWVLLELHDKDTPGKVISSYPALLRRDGFIVSNDGINPPRVAVAEETDYYLVVKHRNHLPVKSGEVVSFSQVAVSQSFDQGNASLQKEAEDGIYTTFAGDITTDNTIDGLDKVIWELMNGTFNQYHTADTNMDGDINGADKGLWFSNNGVFTHIE